jgi:hypothetical protein
MGNPGGGCDIFAKLSEKQIKKQSCFKRTKGSDEGKHEEKML